MKMGKLQLEELRDSSHQRTYIRTTCQWAAPYIQCPVQYNHHSGIYFASVCTLSNHDSEASHHERNYIAETRYITSNN